MTEFVLKGGDKIYIPTRYNKITTLEKLSGTNLFKAAEFSVFDSGRSPYYRGTGAGRIVFPATQEWYEKLVQIYPDLEPPAKHKEAREIILAMFNDGWSCVPCKTPNMAGDFVYMDLITEYVMYDGFPFRGNQHWAYARPFDPKSGKAIIDFVDGKVVLES